MEKVIKSERHQATFFYGSCSRGEEKYGSNVDLLLVLNETLIESCFGKRCGCFRQMCRRIIWKIRK